MSLKLTEAPLIVLRLLIKEIHFVKTERNYGCI